MNGGYREFADAYDALTFNVPYERIAAYYSQIIRRMTGGRRVLDLGCGTGNLSVRLAKRGFKVVGMDASEGMLMYAAQKSHEVTWLRGCMERGAPGVRADAVISTLDNINHLPNREAVESCFRGAAKALEEGGVFAFDVNTIYKHREILGGNTFVYDVDGVYCAWSNEFREEDNGVDIELDLFFERNDGVYIRGGERFREIAFTEQELCEMLEAAGFEVVRVWEYLTTKAPTAASEKLMIVARKR